MKDGLRERYPRFRKGEVVRLTEAAVRANIKANGSLYGAVTSEPRNRLSVNVRRIDQKRQSSYWTGFWRHLKPSERVPLQQTGDHEK